MYGQFFVIFALIFTGYFFRKINVLTDEVSRGLSRFLILFAFPCLLFLKVAGLSMTVALLSEFLLALALSIFFHLSYGLYALGYGKARFPIDKAAAAEIMMIYPNNAFMGFPITLLFFGDLGLFFMLANNIATNISLFSYGIFRLRKGCSTRKFTAPDLLKTFRNPNIIALAAGFLFLLLDIPMPEALDTYLQYISGVCTPIALIFVGSMLPGNSILQIIRNPIVIESALHKNIVFPALTCLALIFFPLPAMITAIVVFASCFPSAAIASVVVEAEGKDGVLACQILVASTALSIITLPAAVKLLQLLLF